jgi:hypothetical protein
MSRKFQRRTLAMKATGALSITDLPGAKSEPKTEKTRAVEQHDLLSLLLTRVVRFLHL